MSYIPRDVNEEDIKKMSNIDLIKRRKELIYDISDVDEEKIIINNYLESESARIINDSNRWIGDEINMYLDDLNELIIILKEIKRRTNNDQWAWREEIW